MLIEFINLEPCHRVHMSVTPLSLQLLHIASRQVCLAGNAATVVALFLRLLRVLSWI